MEESVDKRLSSTYCARFGQIAIELGLVNMEQLKKALSEQVDDDIAHKPHKLLGEIFFEHGWLTFQQIELVLNKLFRK